jgi:hypothetical protein
VADWCFRDVESFVLVGGSAVREVESRVPATDSHHQDAESTIRATESHSQSTESHSQSTESHSQAADLRNSGRRVDQRPVRQAGDRPVRVIARRVAQNTVWVSTACRSAGRRAVPLVLPKIWSTSAASPGAGTAVVQAVPALWPDISSVQSPL